MSRNKREGLYMGKLRWYGEHSGIGHMRTKEKLNEVGTLFAFLKHRHWPLEKFCGK